MTHENGPIFRPDPERVREALKRIRERERNTEITPEHVAAELREYEEWRRWRARPYIEGVLRKIRGRITELKNEENRKSWARESCKERRHELERLVQQIESDFYGKEAD